MNLVVATTERNIVCFLFNMGLAVFVLRAGRAVFPSIAASGGVQLKPQVLSPVLPIHYVAVK